MLCGVPSSHGGHQTPAGIPWYSGEKYVLHSVLTIPFVAPYIYIRRKDSNMNIKPPESPSAIELGLCFAWEKACCCRQVLNMKVMMMAVYVCCMSYVMVMVVVVFRAEWRSIIYRLTNQKKKNRRKKKEERKYSRMYISWRRYLRVQGEQGWFFHLPQCRKVANRLCCLSFQAVL